MRRVYNFSPGPATLPEEVLERAKSELTDWEGQGLSVLEISHHAPKFLEMIQHVQASVRALLNVPDHYEVLFVPAGGRGQFAMVPLNLLKQKTVANYLDTGIWSSLAIAEAKRYAKVHIVASANPSYDTIPDPSKWHIDPSGAYIHYVENETINGVEFPIPSSFPEDMLLVSDMSSNLGTRGIDVSRFGLIYAAAQKNLGPAGITLVIIRKDLLGGALPITPSMFDYTRHASANSLYNTPPTFIWYMFGLVIDWMSAKGGLPYFESLNQRKANKLYDLIDNSDFFTNQVEKKYRSRMNVIFRLSDESLNETFLSEALAAGLSGLKGHSTVGGMRASIYNAMPELGVDALVSFMGDFARRYG